MRINKIIVTALALTLMGCAKTYSIKVEGSEFMQDCPVRAEPGSVVTVSTKDVDDGYITLKGSVELRKIGDGVYDFMMPEDEVSLTAKFYSSGQSSTNWQSGNE